MPVDVKYRTTATAVGGRDGQARTEDGSFSVKLSTPKELGGAGGDGANPEQLFAAGYSACFIGALKVAGQQLKLKVPAETKVTATVGIGPRSEGGFWHHRRLTRGAARRRPRKRGEAGRDRAPDLSIFECDARECGCRFDRRLTAQSGVASATADASRLLKPVQPGSGDGATEPRWRAVKMDLTDLICEQVRARNPIHAVRPGVIGSRRLPPPWRSRTTACRPLFRPSASARLKRRLRGGTAPRSRSGRRNSPEQCCARSAC